jgi:ketosteroid isomerase-like protein
MSFRQPLRSDPLPVRSQCLSGASRAAHLRAALNRAMMETPAALHRVGTGLRVIAVPASLSEEDIDYIREGYRLLEEGDLAFLDRFTPDATLVFPETLPKGGTYGSAWEALEYFHNVGELFEDQRPEPEEFVRDGDRLVVLGHFHGRSRATGEQVAISFAHVFRLSGIEGPLSQQRYAAFELFIDTAAALAAIGGQGVG